MDQKMKKIIGFSVLGVGVLTIVLRYALSLSIGVFIAGILIAAVGSIIAGIG